MLWYWLHDFVRTCTRMSYSFAINMSIYCTLIPQMSHDELVQYIDSMERQVADTEARTLLCV